MLLDRLYRVVVMMVRMRQRTDRIHSTIDTRCRDIPPRSQDVRVHCWVHARFVTYTLLSIVLRNTSPMPCRLFIYSPQLARASHQTQPLVLVLGYRRYWMESPCERIALKRQRHLHASRVFCHALRLGHTQLKHVATPTPLFCRLCFPPLKYLIKAGPCGSWRNSIRRAPAQSGRSFQLV